MLPYIKKHQTLRELYVVKGLSASQVAERIGRSKAWVVDRLKQLKIRVPEDRRGNPSNYRYPQPPYGYTIRNGALALNRREMKICRLVVEWHERGQKTFTEIARLLVQKGLKNRRGHASWQHVTVRNIYRRWRGKL